ncbi:Alpha/Beta hydrolase protein [Chytridium lagenaria]|nr:Alpha/Beta hydrolase protein [Chytridium lagenaria]
MSTHPNSHHTVSLPPLFTSPTASIVHMPHASSFITYEDSHANTHNKPSTIAYCVPGIGDLRHSYRFLSKTLIAQGFRVIAQDMRGTGDSGTQFKTYSIEDVASDIIAVLDHAQINQPVTLLCNSLSAASAITVASEHASRVKGVITFGGFFRDMPGDKYFRPASHILFTSLWGTSVWISAFRSFFKSPPLDIEEYVAAVTRKMTSDPNHIAVIGKMIRTTKDIAWSKISSVKVPVLLVMGSLDPDFSDPKAESEVVAKALTGGKRVEILMVDGAGHYPHVEKSGEVGESVVRFMGTL